MATEPIIINPDSSETEGLNGFSWEEYRRVCDEQALGVRKVGLLDKDLAMASIRDPRTTIVNIGKNIIPVLTPIKYAAGYDAQRCSEIARTSIGEDIKDIYYFCLPPNSIQDGPTKEKLIAELSKLRKEKCAIFFDFVEADAVTQQELLDLLTQSGVQYHEVSLQDSRAEEAYRNVSINYYKVVLTSIESLDGQDTIEERPNDIYEAFSEACDQGEFEKFPNDGATLLKGQEIPDELVDQLWDIYQNRFEWLGENHPISMEENKHEFVELLRNPQTVVCVYFVSSEPVCWTYGVLDPNAEVWLREEFIKEHIEQDEVPFFFPGIVAKADSIGGYSEPTITFVAKIMAKTGKKFAVMFETTNLSEQYIPSIVEGYISNSGEMEVETPVRIDNTLYGLLAIN